MPHVHVLASLGCCQCAADDCTWHYASNQEAGGDGESAPLGGPVENGAVFGGFPPVWSGGDGTFDSDWWEESGNNTPGDATPDTDADGGKIIFSGDEAFVWNTQDTSLTSAKIYNEWDYTTLTANDKLRLAWDVVDDDNFIFLEFWARTDLPTLTLYRRTAGVDAVLRCKKNDMSVASGGSGWSVASFASNLILRMSICRRRLLCQVDGVPQLDFSGIFNDADDIHPGRFRSLNLSVGQGSPTGFTLASGVWGVGADPVGSPKMDLCEARNTDINGDHVMFPECRPLEECDGLLTEVPTSFTMRSEGITKYGYVWTKCSGEGDNSVVSPTSPGVNYELAEDCVCVEANNEFDVPYAPITVEPPGPEEVKFCRWELVDDNEMNCTTYDACNTNDPSATFLILTSEVELVPNLVRASIGLDLGAGEYQAALSNFYHDGDLEELELDEVSIEPQASGVNACDFSEQVVTVVSANYEANQTP